MELESEDGGLRLAQTTILTIEGEMAFWMRWGLDHLGDETIPLSNVLKNFDGGNVNDDERGSRVIENAEISQFENFMSSITSHTSSLVSVWNPKRLWRSFQCPDLCHYTWI